MTERKEVRESKHIGLAIHSNCYCGLQMKTPELCWAAACMFTGGGRNWNKLNVPYLSPSYVIHILRMTRFVTVDSNVISISQGSTAMRRLYLYSTFEYKNQTITLLPCGYMQNLLIQVTPYQMYTVRVANRVLEGAPGSSRHQ